MKRRENSPREWPFAQPTCNTTRALPEFVTSFQVTTMLELYAWNTPPDGSAFDVTKARSGARHGAESWL